MKRLIAAILMAGLGGVTSVQAKNSYKISMAIEMISSVGVYQAQGRDSLDQVSGRRETKTRVQGEGVFAPISKETRTVDEDVIGIDSNGHSRISLENENGRIYLHVDLRMDDTIDDTPVKVEVNYKAEARFTQGDWDVYAAGGDVKVELTEDGQKAAIEAASARLRQTLRGIKDALSSQLAGNGAEFGTIKVDSWKASSPTTIQGNKNRLVLESGTSRIEMSFAVLADF